jgi:hypothetical protein
MYDALAQNTDLSHGPKMRASGSLQHIRGNPRQTVVEARKSGERWQLKRSETSAHLELASERAAYAL